ncbi:MAG TPA: hypothetical protein ENO19_00800 [Halothiobacillaceae bacterium]|nr:hypothetical protein [Halothiobacillaceae bacterium]
MTESIIVVRLTRNLRYKLTYIHIFEKYLEAGPEPEVAELLRELIEAQQSAIAPVSRYLRRHEVQVQEVELDDRLMTHAFGRDDVRSQLRFIYDGLRRAVSWYKTQLVDKQMGADDEVVSLLFELGEIDAAKLWRTEALMGMLRVPTSSRQKEWEEHPRPQQSDEQEWRPRLVEDLGRPAWRGSVKSNSPGWPRPSKYGRGDSRKRGAGE